MKGFGSMVVVPNPDRTPFRRPFQGLLCPIQKYVVQASCVDRASLSAAAAAPQRNDVLRDRLPPEPSVIMFVSFVRSL